VRLKPNFRALGPVFAERTPAVAAAIEDADPDRVVAALEQQGEATVGDGADRFTVTAEQVQVLEEARTGWQVASDGPYAVALDVTLDDDLRAEGRAREFVRAVNELRKRAELELDDRIVLTVDADAPFGAALAAHRDWITGEVLAVAWREEAAADAETVELGDGTTVRVAVHPAR
jgi:isoleucyl-tRNA synthetase